MLECQQAGREEEEILKRLFLEQTSENEKILFLHKPNSARNVFKYILYSNIFPSDLILIQWIVQSVSNIAAEAAKRSFNNPPGC